MRVWVLVVVCGSAASVAAAMADAPVGSDGPALDAGTGDAPPTDAATDATIDATAAVDAVAAPNASSPRDAMPAPEPPERVDFSDGRFYLTTSFQVSASGLPFLRLSLGGSYRSFSRDGSAPFDLRAGATVYVSRDLYIPNITRGAGGFGGEAQIVGSTGLGARVGIETAPSESDNNGGSIPFLVTAGLRYYPVRNAFLALDVYYVTNDAYQNDPNFMATQTGVLVGIGFTSTSVPVGQSHYEPPPKILTVRPLAPRIAPPVRDEQAQRAARQRAWTDLDEATKAALHGDCALVERIGADVRALDPDFYDHHYVVDPVVGRCYGLTARPP